MAARPAGQEPGRRNPEPEKILLALGIGLGIGLYDGIVGPGTGTFAIIAFTTLMGFDLRTAGGNGKS